MLLAPADDDGDDGDEDNDDDIVTCSSLPTSPCTAQPLLQPMELEVPTSGELALDRELTNKHTESDK